MASMVDAFRDAFSENLAYVKIALYAIPVYFVVNFYMTGNWAMFQTWAPVLGILIFGLFTQAIYNVRNNKREVLSLNPIEFLVGLLKTSVVLIPNLLIFGTLGYYIASFKFQVNVPYFNEIYQVVVLTVFSSIILTSYLAFAKFQSIKQGFNYKTIFESCADVLIQLIFMVIQLAIVELVLVGPVAYLYFYFHVLYTHWTFVAYCSAVVVMNVSILANYLAQMSTEFVKGHDDEYKEGSTLNDITGDSINIDVSKYHK